jgi:hypothetical protein
MATATQSKTTPPIDAAFEQVKDLQERFAKAARDAGVLYVEAYEKAVDQATELELKLADSTQPEWLEGLIRAHANITREVTESYTSTARSLLQ